MVFGNTISVDRRKCHFYIRNALFCVCDYKLLIFYAVRLWKLYPKHVSLLIKMNRFTKNGKYIPPNEFIPIAEENGLIVPLGYWIIEQAAMQFQE